MNMKSYKGMKIYKENKPRNDGSKTNAKDQWDTIKNLEYIEV